MRLLLDTHVLIWWLEDSSRLGPDARDAIATAPVAFVSAASAWEMAIKVRLGKLRIPQPIDAALVEHGFSALPIRIDHAESVAALPDHHGDPFDQMLIAQARSEGLTVVTHDRVFSSYPIEVLWA